MAKQGRILTEFYRSYLAWFEAGSPDGTYSKSDGLCLALEYFLGTKGLCGGDAAAARQYEMKRQFVDAGLNPIFPFEDAVDYFERDDLHLNPKRIEWVRSHAKGE